MRVTCEKCVYWKSPKADTEERLGECRRNPPVHEFWPVTLPDDWCGQAMPKDTRASKYYQEEDEDSEQCKPMPIETAPFDDVRVRVEKLGNGCPAGTQIELLALYLPTGAIGNLAVQALAMQAGGGA